MRRLIGVMACLAVACDDTGEGTRDAAPDVVDALGEVDAPDGDDAQAEVDEGDAAGEVGSDAAGDVAEEVGADASDPEVIDPGPVDSTEPIDDDLVPCDAPEYWPFSVLSETVPVRVHHRERRDGVMAAQVLRHLETAWEFEVEQMGWAPPIDDDGRCGPDGAFDVFLRRDYVVNYVDVFDDVRATEADDGLAYMVLDPWGPFGGSQLDATAAHEFNHACQAAYDWNDATFLYEATATFIEDVVHDDDDNYLYLLGDFQYHTDWSLDHDDGYEGWYMYGAALWLHFLNERYFRGDATFAVRLWEGLVSAPGTYEPDFADSLDAMLDRVGRSYVDTVVEFARWRWYVGERDDGRHLSEAGAFPEDATPRVAATVPSSGGSAAVKPMMLGTVYVDVVAGAGDPVDVVIDLEAPANGAVSYVVQAVPGLDGSDGETLRLPARVALTDEGGAVHRTIIVTAVPGPLGDADPDERTEARFPATLRVSAPAGR